MGVCFILVIPMIDFTGGLFYVRSCIGGAVLYGADLVWD
jgi:hypothetical protein